MKVKLKEIGIIITGNTPKTSEVENYSSADIPFVKPSDIHENDILRIGESEYWISEYARKKARILPPDSVLVTCIGIIGKVAINTCECAFNQQINAIIPDSERYLPEYIAYAILAKQKYLQDIANAPVVPIINKSQFADIDIQTTDIQTQKSVVDKLSRVSELIKLNNCRLNKLDELIKSRFIEMFGDPVINPMCWERKPFLQIGSCKNGMNFHNDESGVNIHCLGVGNFKDLSTIQDTSVLPIVSLNEMPSDEYMLQNNDIVFVRSNGNKALVGRCLTVYPYNIPTTFSGFCIRFRIENRSVAAPYLLRALKSDSIRNKIKGRGANIQNLNQKILSKLEIPIPPMNLQNQFADFVTQVEKQKATVQQSIDKLETLKKSLMQECFG